MKAKKILLALLLFVGSKLIAQPSTTASTPTKASADVISVFSDAYTSISGTNFNPNWGQGTQVSDTTVSGDNIKKYGNLDYQGTQLGSRVNASSMENLHFDIWTPNGTQIQIFMVNEGNTGGPTEQSVTLTLTQNGWNSIDIPMSSYHSTIVSSISQFKIQVPGFAYHASPYHYYLDNIYFWKSANIPTISGFSFPTKYTTDAPFQITPPTSNSNGAFTYTSSNTNVATISGDTITIVGAAGTSTITANQAADGAFSTGSTTSVLTVTFAPPTTAPATPTQMAANVISIFSNEYTPISGINFNPNWGQSTAVLDMNVASNDIKRYSNLNYQGTEFASALNVSSMDSLHFDIWTPNLNSFDFYLISFSPNIEQKVTVTPTKNGWNSYNFPLSSFPSVDKSALRQFKYVGSPSGSTAYLDNIYFYRAAGAPTITGFSVPAKNLGDAAFNLTDPTSNSSGAFTYTSSNTNVATISGSTVTIVGVGSTTITANQAADGGFNAGSTTAILVVSYPPPSTAAPTPTRDTADVLSVFSDAYPNVSGTDFYPNWGQSTVVSNISVGGNTTKKYHNLNYQGVQFASPVDASQMTELHFDLWTPNCTAFDFYLINAGNVEQKVTVNPTANGWNSYDISLSQYTAINKSAIIQFKLVGTPFGSSAVYLDNIYFWKATPVTLGTFTVPAKEVGDAAFSLTAPTSNSPGAFTYTSSNTNVATISGSTVTIVGAGTSTITAAQAATGNYGSASTTASLVVTLPVLPQAPIVAAPVPTQHPFNVISVFSDSYTNVSGTNFNPGWGQSTQVADTTIEGNTTKKYTNLNYQGIQLAGTINASAASHLHIDIWTANCTAFKVFLINTATGAEQPYTINPTLAGWNSVDIPLTSYNANIVNHVNQIKFESVPFGGAKVYMDNLYFWANSCLNHVSDPSLTLVENANDICAGTNITFTAMPTNGGTNANYNFKVDGTSVQNGASAVYNSNALQNGSSVTCVITRTDGCANDGNSNSVVMIIKPLPAIASISSDAGSNLSNINLCSIGKTVPLYASLAGGIWSNSNSNSVQLSSASNSGSSTRTITALAPGSSTLSYTITASTTGCSSSKNITVNVAPVDAPASITGSSSVCVGNSTTFNCLTAGGNWVSGGRGTISNSGTFTASNAGSTNVKYVVTNLYGCSNSSTANLTINALPSIPTIAYAPGTSGVTGSGGICKNKTFTVVGTPTNGVWSKTGVISVSPAGTNSTTTSISTGSVTGAASVSYTVTNANGCSNTRTVNINIVNCSAKGINSNIISNDVTFYPNPAKSFITVNANNIIGDSKITITDLLGKQILQQNLSIGSNKIDVSKLSKGMYLVTTINNNENKTQKLIIE